MKNRRLFFYLTIAVIFISVLIFNSGSAQAASAKLNRTKATICVGETLQLYVKNNTKRVKWYSNKKSVATVSSKGKVKAKKEGTVIITAKIGVKKYPCKITVYKTKISSSEMTISYGLSEKLQLLYSGKKVTWSSSDKNIAYADGENVYAVSVGTATITAKCNGKSYQCKITVVSGEDGEIVPRGYYTSKEKVALYINKYKTLPDNFITKEEARSLGWTGGELLSYAKYKCIGGDVFSNYEKKLPVAPERIYYECDIDTLGALSRGAKRIVYSNDGLIYYTEDHYETFEQLY